MPLPRPPGESTSLKDDLAAMGLTGGLRRDLQHSALHLIQAADRVHDAVSAALFIYEGSAPGRPGEGVRLMDPIIVPTLTALTGVAMRGIAAAELLARLRWQERQRRADRDCLTELARALPRGCQLDDLRADGSELRLVITRTGEPAERPST